MWAHCQLYGPYLPQYDTLSQMGQLLFGTPFKHGERMAHDYSQAVQRVATADAADDLHDLTPFIEGIANHVRTHEDAFARHFVETAYPILRGDDARQRTPAETAALLAKGKAFFDSRVGMSELAKTQVREVAKIVETKVDEGAVEELSVRLRVVFPMAFAFYNEVARKTSMTAVNIERDDRRNWLWDYDLSFAVDSISAPSKPPVVLVTGDRAIRDAAQAVGERHRVLSVQEYEAFLAA
jgi:hypothetical protein